MEVKVEKWQVGAFIFAGLLLFCFSIFFLGAGRSFQTYNHYRVEFDQVQGLNPGSIVSLAGITVGNIDKIEFNETNHHIEIKIRIAKNLAGQITEGTIADLRTQGALGDKYLYLSPGPVDQKPIEDGGIIPTLKNKDIMSVLTERGGETEKIFDIIGDVKKVTGQMSSEKRIERILENLTVASENFKVASVQAAKLAQNQKIEQSMTRLDNILMKIEKGQGTLGALINDPSLHEQLKAMVGGSKSKDDLRKVLRTTIKDEK